MWARWHHVKCSGDLAGSTSKYHWSWITKRPVHANWYDKPFLCGLKMPHSAGPKEISDGKPAEAECCVTCSAALIKETQSLPPSKE